VAGVSRHVFFTVVLLNSLRFCCAVLRENDSSRLVQMGDVPTDLVTPSPAAVGRRVSIQADNRTAQHGRRQAYRAGASLRAVDRLDRRSAARNYLANSGLNRGEYQGSVAMRLHTYRDENRSRHIDLISGGQHPRSIDLVVILTSSILVIAAACALIAPFASTTVGLARWIH